MQIEHKFDNVNIATRELNGLGFSLGGPLFHGELYHVVPREIQDDYPMMSDGKTPRFVAVVDFTGTLIFAEPYDKNPVLIRYQEILKRATAIE